MKKQTTIGVQWYVTIGTGKKSIQRGVSMVKKQNETTPTVTVTLSLPRKMIKSVTLLTTATLTEERKEITEHWNEAEKTGKDHEM